MRVEFSREEHGPVVTTVHMLDLEPIIRDPDYDNTFLYQENGWTYIMHTEEDSLEEDFENAELGVRGSVAWYLYLARQVERKNNDST
jgi:hypothetical protein